MSGVKVQGSASGAGNFTITPPVGGATDRVVTLPDRTGNLMMDGPAFQAYQNTSQTLPGNDVATLLVIDVKDFDSASCFNNTNATVNGIPAYAFRPNVAGYYYFGGVLTGNISGNNYNYVMLYKNGVNVRNGGPVSSGAAAGIYSGLTVSGLFYMNGTTDYMQLMGGTNGAAATTITGLAGTAFWAHMARGA